ncbi:MAG: hypothetical protein KJ065_06520 [Anaerolineae bacterium]|nr:hypothetical protein [Anaerolineae bacterium]
MRQIGILILGVVFVLGIQAVRAQDTDLIPFSWTKGDAAFAYPADWAAPISSDTDTGAILMLMPQADGSDAHVAIETVLAPAARPFDLLAARLSAVGVTASAPTNTTLGGLAAIEVRSSAGDGIGRATVRADGSVLLIYGSTDAPTGDAMQLAFEQIAASLALGARQMPTVPDGDGATFTRMGSERLEAGTAALGSLQPGAAAQTWTYAGATGEEISVFSTDINRLETLNVRLRLNGPDGVLLAENDSHGGGVLYGLFSLYDAALSNIVLPTDGIYTITVESVFGAGVYGIGIARTQSLVLNSDSATRVQGVIDDVFAAETWSFAGHAGQVYTFTMFAAEGTTLDPALRLFGPDGDLIAQNDDARDVALGLNAQLVQVQFPVDGIYRLEATRYAGEGEGAYEIVIVTTS